MITTTQELLRAAQTGGYAVGAFNVYNLEGVKAVIAAAEVERSPVMLQIHPGALKYGGQPLVALCLTAAKWASVPAAVHLDHSSSAKAIGEALAAGLPSIMADGSHLPYEENVAFTREMTTLAHARGAAVEAELGRISGTEDDLTIAEFEARFTDPEQATDFVVQTGVDALAVCIGNVHGVYNHAPALDFSRLAAIREAVDVPLVLHGASGLPEHMVRESIALGITKLNVNTELRGAFIASLRERLVQPESPDLVVLLDSSVAAMQTVVAEKLRQFGSSGRA
jgi:tagatose 1,6-diphosphate aldolase GatY/KbaY